ncbi:N-acetyltransferase [Streptomyces sp. NPDC051183]|uniref:N-acetyltransferase n=1 Tax=Streptomyces sp. NPDC051183 TaxID=3155165 RepID=UPI00342F4DF4
MSDETNATNATNATDETDESGTTTDRAGFVPDGFDAPGGLEADGFRLEPLGPEHNERDLAAWSGSIAHIRATPGFLRSWPPLEGMSAEENLADLVRHARDFADRRGFTYSVLEGEADVIGCLYVYPAKEEPGRVHVSSWVRADRAHLDAPLYEAVSRWLREEWPFDADRVDYAPR